MAPSTLQQGEGMQTCRRQRQGRKGSSEQDGWENAARGGGEPARPGMFVVHDAALTSDVPQPALPAAAPQPRNYHTRPHSACSSVCLFSVATHRSALPLYRGVSLNMSLTRDCVTMMRLRWRWWVGRRGLKGVAGQE
jgi:hypothetical protein